MEKETFDDYVTNRYKKQMEYYSKTSAKLQKKYRLFQWMLIILSALTPVLAALSAVNWSHDKTDTTYSQLIQILLVIISSIVAILTTGLKTFQYQELWVIYRATLEQLKPEYYYYEFNVEPYGTWEGSKEALFVTRVETILSKEQTQWTFAKKSKSESDKEKTQSDNPNENTENAKK